MSPRWRGACSLPYALPTGAMNHHLRVPLPHLPSESRQTHPDPVPAPPRDAPHRAAEREAQATCKKNNKKGLMPLTWVRGVFGCPGRNPLLPSLPVPWLYVAWKTRGPCRQNA